MKKAILSLLMLALLLSGLVDTVAMPAAALDDTVTLTASGSLADALNTVADGGTIEIEGTHAVASDLVWPTHSKSVTLTGGTLDLTAIGKAVHINGNVTFDNMTLTAAESATVYANGHAVTVRENVTVTNTAAAIYGGGAAGTTVPATNLTLLAGNYLDIYGGSNGGTVTGDTHVTVGGTVNTACDWTAHASTYEIYGGGNADTIGGDTHMTFTGGAKANYIWGGSRDSNAEDDAVPTIAGDKYALMSGGSTMSFYGGNNGVNTGAGSHNYTTMTGGRLQQLFGGNQEASMTGDVYLRVLGGTVTRRIYGGCYNEAVRDGVTFAWRSSHMVTGNIILTFGENVTVTLTNDGYIDHCISARSRYKEARSDERCRILFLGDGAYSKWSGLLGYTTVFSFSFTNTTALGDHYFGAIMDAISTADETHTMTYTASGATITEACSLCSTAHSATATLALKDGAELTYTGEPITPAEVVYDTGWKSESSLAIAYLNNVNTGTATATATYVPTDTTVTLDFTIEKAERSAPAVSGVAESIKGKGDGGIDGLTTEMEISTDGTSFSAVTDTAMLLAPGTYYVRYAEADNHKTSATTAVTVAESDQLLTVTFVADGTTVATSKVPWNGSLTELPDIPEKTGYTQTAPVWSVTALSELTSDLTVTAIYTPNTYTVTFVADGVTVDTITVRHGESVTELPDIPEKTGYTQTPPRWNGTTTNIKSNTTLHARYTINRYTVTFSVDGKTYATRTIAHGETLTNVPAVPEKTGYNGAWESTDFNTVTGDMTAVAVYTPKQYTVTFTADGVTVATRTVTHGASLTDLPAVPEKTGYNGTWKSTDFDTVTGDMTVTATYTLKIHTVTFMVGEKQHASRVVRYGEALTDIPALPEKVGYTDTAPYWNVSDLSCIVSDMTVNAVYTANLYTVTFVADGSTVGAYTVCHGEALTDIPAIPPKAGHSAAWNTSNFDTVSRDMTVEAIYTALPAEPEPEPEPDQGTAGNDMNSTPGGTPDDIADSKSDGDTVVIVIAVVAGTLAVGGAVTVVLLKKKKNGAPQK